eukprot:CAMPEP_0119567824 /NCGR_PEP_ID=MMETSP1352-20130426/37133_1 /TAXON_ID=265584 /ORGANISM="Stauroneis constricta, Strain CCMP1120" /LENGTH=39 /DNA_ID= /DNA_START= /DNA_END= /DNA_ORIENTATION=
MPNDDAPRRSDEDGDGSWQAVMMMIACVSVMRCGSWFDV